MSALLLLAVLSALHVQDPPSTDISIGASPDTVRVGEHLELTATVPVPAGYTLFVPDTLLPTGYVETRRPVQWSVAAHRGDTTVVHVSYTLAVYRPGPTPLPPIPVILRNREPAERGTAERLPNSGYVGEWSTLPRVPDFSYVRTVVEAPEIYTAPTLFEFDLMEGAAPRGITDVAGGSWSVGALGLGALVLLGLGVGAALFARWTRAPEPEDEAPVRESEPVEPDWRRALRELDRIYALGLHRTGAVEEFYARFTNEVRRYVESLDPRWGPELTATELVGRANGRLGEGRAGPLGDVLLRSERVKFGRDRPSAEASEADWAALREWVARAGGGNAPPPVSRNGSGSHGAGRPAERSAAPKSTGRPQGFLAGGGGGDT